MNRPPDSRSRDAASLATIAGRRNGTARTRLATLIRLVRVRSRSGLVARQPCPGDARGALFSLTEQGRAALDQAAPLHVASVRRHIIDLLTPGDIAALDTIAGKVITHLAGQLPSEHPPR